MNSTNETNHVYFLEQSAVVVSAMDARPAARAFQALGLVNVPSHDLLVTKLHDPETIMKAKDCFSLISFLCINRHGFEGPPCRVNARVLLSAYLIHRFPGWSFPTIDPLARNLIQATASFLQSFDNIMGHLLDENNGGEVPHEVTEGFIRCLRAHLEHFEAWRAMDKPLIIQRIEAVLTELYNVRANASVVHETNDVSANVVLENATLHINRLRIKLQLIGGLESVRAFDERRNQ